MPLLQRPANAVVQGQQFVERKPQALPVQVGAAAGARGPPVDDHALGDTGRFVERLGDGLAFDEILQARYEPVESVPGFGQAGTTLELWRLKPEIPVWNPPPAQEEE